MSIQVQKGREMQENYLEDEAVLTSYMHDMRAAREDADKELAHMRKMAEEAHKDWQRKLKDRRKEVRCSCLLHGLTVWCCDQTHKDGPVNPRSAAGRSA